jgi:hypothetical protein
MRLKMPCVGGIGVRSDRPLETWGTWGEPGEPTRVFRKTLRDKDLWNVAARESSRDGEARRAAAILVGGWGLSAIRGYLFFFESAAALGVNAEAKPACGGGVWATWGRFPYIL